MLGCCELTSNRFGGAALASGYHNEQLHDGVVDPGTSRLNNEDIFLADAGQDADARFALGARSLVDESCDAARFPSAQLGSARLGRADASQ